MRRFKPSRLTSPASDCPCSVDWLHGIRTGLFQLLLQRRSAVRTSDVGDLGKVGHGGRDSHVDVHVAIGDERVPLAVLSGEVELLPQEAGHVRITCRAAAGSR